MVFGFQWQAWARKKEFEQGPKGTEVSTARVDRRLSASIKLAASLHVRPRRAGWIPFSKGLSTAGRHPLTPEVD